MERGSLEIKLDPNISPHGGGNVTYRITVDGRWIGWVGDGREWRGSHYGARKWWACWREEGDTAARWNTGLTHTSRKSAIAELLTKAGVS
jgi:hypothetical protein